MKEHKFYAGQLAHELDGVGLNHSWPWEGWDEGLRACGVRGHRICTWWGGPTWAGQTWGGPTGGRQGHIYRGASALIVITGGCDRSGNAHEPRTADGMLAAWSHETRAPETVAGHSGAIGESPLMRVPHLRPLHLCPASVECIGTFSCLGRQPQLAAAQC